MDTLGGGLERLARDRDAPALFLISVVVALKIVAAVLPILLVSGRASVAWTRRLRALAWLEAAIREGEASTLDHQPMTNSAPRS